MTKRFTMLLALVLVLVVGAGCGLMGFDTQLQSTTEIEATLDALASAGEAKDEERLKRYLASTLITQVLSGEGFEAPSQESKDEVIERVRAIWSDMSMNQVNVTVGDVNVRGNGASANGSFVVDVTDAAGSRAYCVGNGEASLDRSSGEWALSGVTVTNYTCEVSEGNGATDDEGAFALQAVSQAPSVDFEVCEYMVLGSSGNQVRALQQALTSLGYSPGLIDGDFGPKTYATVREFQSKNGLYVDGEAGPKTLTVVNDLLKANGGRFECGTNRSVPNFGSTQLVVSSLASGTSYETPVYTYQSPEAGPTLVFLGCIHGNERSGHYALSDAIEQGISISRGRLVIVPEFNRNACESGNRTYRGHDFNRLFPVGGTPKLTIGKEMWELVRSQPDLALVVDFHDGFNHSLANTLITTQQSKIKSAAAKIRNELNGIRPSNARGPRWRSFTEPIGGSLTRKTGRDLGVPALEVELAGRTNPDPLSLRKEYASHIIKRLGSEFGMEIAF